MEATNGHGRWFIGGRARLAQSALRLKKAWLAAALLAGHRLTKDEAAIPDYGTWTRKHLQQHVADLEADLQAALGVVLVRAPNRVSSPVASWLAKRFDDWAEWLRKEITRGKQR